MDDYLPDIIREARERHYTVSPAIWATAIAGLVLGFLAGFFA